MSFANLKTDESIQEEVDTVGSSGPVDSALYLSNINMAYFHKSAGGALAVVLYLENETGREVRETIYVTSGDAKGNRNFYEDKQGAKKYLPGFNLVNSLCRLAVDKELGDVDTEEKTINIYNFDEKKEVPTKVTVLTPLLGQKVLAGILKVVEDKNVKDAAGNYVPSGETRTINNLDKVFHAGTRMTVAELLANASEAAFVETWSAKWTGVERDRSTKGAVAPAGGAAANSGTAPKPTTSLFKAS
jgi:hypothetical protein